MCIGEDHSARTEAIHVRRWDFPLWIEEPDIPVAQIIREYVNDVGFWCCTRATCGGDQKAESEAENAYGFEHLLNGWLLGICVGGEGR